MGKQSKRNKSKRGNKQRNNSGSQNTSAAASTSSEEKGGVSTIVSKIRHGDPRVRHAALVALSSTLYHSSSLSAAAAQQQRQTGGGAEASDETLLRALSERILDVDIPCATTATGCLSNYVSFYCTGDAIDETSKGAVVASEIMVPILLQRIQRSLEKIKLLGAQIESSPSSQPSSASPSTSADASNAVDKTLAFNTEQWNLVSLSLQTLAGLIENFPSAVERVSATSLSTVCDVLPLVDKSIQLLSRNESQAKNNIGYILDASSNASRSIHSLLDDNVTIITSIQPASLKHIVTILTNTITNVHMPHMARLHASGALLSLRKVLVLDAETHSSTTHGGEYGTVVAAVQTCTDNTVIELLSNLFENEDTTHPKQLVRQMIELSNKCQSMKQDEMMESEIVNQVNARKEPARMIAKRQKEMKESKKAMTENEDMVEDKKEIKEDHGMAVVEKDDGEEDGGKVNDEARFDDVKDELDKVVESWRELVGSYKLALELVANLCSGKEEGEEDMDGDGMMYPDDDEHMWDSDDEAKLLSSANTAGTFEKSMEMCCTPSERATYAAMSLKHLLEHILSFFQKWVEFLPVLNDDVPALVEEDIDELQSTCALCLGNMVACDLPFLTETAMKNSVLVGDQETPVKEGLDLFWWELIATISSGVREAPRAHITSVMLALLRNQPKARALVNAAVLDLLLDLLLTPQDNNTDGSTNNVQTKCNSISILGLLCSEPHPSEINTRVCSALLERLRTPLSSTSNETGDGEKTRQSLVIMNEIFNVLMDMYGGDDSHDEVFARQDVLGHIQRCLPGFKRSIKKAGASSGREDVETWNETAINCSRFIKYKKEG